MLASLRGNLEIEAKNRLKIAANLVYVSYDSTQATSVSLVVSST